MNNKMYHIDVSLNELGKYVLMPGDPFRTDIIAQYLDQPVLVAHNREYKSWNGYLDGELVSVVSTGIGGSSAAIAIEELIKIGAHTFIRIGTAGRISDEANKPEVRGVICTAAVRDEGLTSEYVPLSFPAVAHIDIINAFIKAKEKSNASYIKGITHCKESFYGQIEPERMPLSNELKRQWNIWKKANVACAEMESSTLFVLSSIYNKRAGSIMAFDDSMDETIQLAIEALKILIVQDKQKL